MMMHERTTHIDTLKIRKLRMIAGLMLCLAFFWTLCPGQAAADDRQDLVITVVEELPPEEIEENEVPLAAFPGSGNRSGIRHLILMSLTLAAVITYVWYFTRFEKRLFSLRNEAARVESGWQTERRRQRQEGKRSER